MSKIIKKEHFADLNLILPIVDRIRAITSTPKIYTPMWSAVPKRLLLFGLLVKISSMF